MRQKEVEKIDRQSGRQRKRKTGTERHRELLFRSDEVPL